MIKLRLLRNAVYWLSKDGFFTMRNIVFHAAFCDLFGIALVYG